MISSDRYRLWDFLSERGRNSIVEWVRQDRLTVRDRAALNNKFKRLAQIEYDLAIKTKLLAGPIYKHVYKLVIHADVMLRPMLCRGPIEVDGEYTMLLGAVEVGGELPAGSEQKAEERREIVVRDPTRRCPHERIPNR